jgi:hypothetical protein
MMMNGRQELSIGKPSLSHTKPGGPPAGLAKTL